MKKIVFILMIAMGLSAVAFAQTKSAKESKNSVETQVIALEKAGWEAWKNKESSWFQNNLAKDYLMVNSDGVYNKSQSVQSIGSDCEVNSYSLDNFKFVMLDKNAAMITFTGTQDGACNGKTIPSTVNATAVYVKRGGKWLSALYTETPAVQ